MNSKDLVFILEREVAEGLAVLKLEDGGKQILKAEFDCGGRTDGKLPGSVYLDKSNLTKLKQALGEMLQKLEELSKAPVE